MPLGLERFRTFHGNAHSLKQNPQKRFGRFLSRLEIATVGHHPSRRWNWAGENMRAAKLLRIPSSRSAPKRSGAWWRKRSPTVASCRLQTVLLRSSPLFRDRVCRGVRSATNS